MSVRVQACACPCARTRVCKSSRGGRSTEHVSVSAAGPKPEACDVFDGVSCLPAVTAASGILLKPLAPPPNHLPNLGPKPASFEASYPRKLKAVFKEQTREEEGSADEAEEKGFVTGVTARWRVKKGLWCLSSTPI